MDYRKNYSSWLEDPYISEDVKKELREITDENEIKDRFHKNLEFGTGGLRGIIGAGTNRMNVYTVRKATQGLANYILKQGQHEKQTGVCIAHDSRRMSPEFTKEAALCLNANGIKTYIFDGLRPTPQLSFAVRELGCTAGIVITASHNPPEYNGYKAYWSDGGQIPYPKDEEIIDEVNKVTDFSQIKSIAEEEAAKKGLFNVLDKEIDDKFIKSVLSASQTDVKNIAGNLTVVFTPLNGAGNVPVRRALDELGFTNVFVVKEQELPDSEFTTIGYPNPEDPNAFKLALQSAKEKSADIVIATDPDCDRVGAVALHNGEYVFLNGNMTGILLTEYILSKKKEKGVLAENSAVVSTIVSTNLTRRLAESYGAAYFEVLTGFKYIGEKIKEFGNNYEYVFGFEESYGYLPGTYSRDKDGVGASMLLCEMAAVYKNQGKTVIDRLNEIYEKYGFYKEKNVSFTLKGIEGAGRIKEIMSHLRQNPLSSLGGFEVLKMRDYKSGIVTDIKTGAKSETHLPKSDVLYYELEQEGWFCVRPSGTEPKIKIYFGACASDEAEAQKRLDSLLTDFDGLWKNL